MHFRIFPLVLGHHEVQCEVFFFFFLNILFGQLYYEGILKKFKGAHFMPMKQVGMMRKCIFVN